MRHLVHTILFYSLGGEASLEELRKKIEYQFEAVLPRNWKVQVRDVLKHDPEFEKTDDKTWVIRTQDSSET